MLSRSIAVAAESRQSHLPSGVDSSVQPKRIPLLASYAALICFCLTMLVVGVMTAARTGTIRQLLDLPPRYFPGNPLPEDVSCYTHDDEHAPRCFVQLFGEEVYFNFDGNPRTILRTIIPAQAYTIGQLILSWGAPSGIRRNYYTIYVYWGTRSALLYTNSFQPDSRVEFILYDLEQQPTSPWRGFTYRRY